MEKSIENIWKEGFVTNKALVVPKVNNLYNTKSVHITEKFKRMFKINVWAIVAFSSLLFVGAIFAGAFLAGCILYVMMLLVAYTAYVDSNRLSAIDKGQSSYVYLKSFKAWIDHSIERYGKLYRFVYPGILLTFYFGIWFSDMFAGMRDKVTANTDDLIFGLHTYTTLLVLVAAAFMSLFSKAIHRADVKAMYGTIMKKLEEAIIDMEVLREEK